MTHRAEMYPLAYSTAYLGLAALITIRENADNHFDEASVDYARSVLSLIRNQPETVLMLPPSEIEEMGPHILENAKAWPDDE